MDATSNTSDNYAEQRQKKEHDIRRHSDAYGYRWCSENAPHLAAYMKAWRAEAPLPALEVRTYNRELNTMKMVPLSDVLALVKCEEESNHPVALKQTAFGQVSLSPTLFVSSNIYALLRAVWTVTLT